MKTNISSPNETLIVLKGAVNIFSEIAADLTNDDQNENKNNQQLKDPFTARESKETSLARKKKRDMQRAIVNQQEENENQEY